ncbi:iron-containing alcohol dehydrogenase [Photobacterium aphoticum]|uniref:Alcohol dehydrogenase n=1 Tax=Photobacterium aphoticum TaxID=754436 RepID=A0A0J1GPI1_9GAMM|nr:iron-containing alcohol dehydrogenase [Photobacterium aphoticum]KLV01665.1 alcohol dehydrogenase [Photobacterium aphoticum]PSU59237.1 alcohol dehydrogenase [Photobacterium aphoticum]GHA31234.1 alcohol dehydrogenase [Photobacterium aphoticum]
MSTLHWHFPTEIAVGEHISQHLPHYCEQANIQNPFFVVDPQLLTTPLIQGLLAPFKPAENSVFSQFNGEPTEAHITEAIQACRSAQHDGVIGIGGGSAIDIAKAIALLTPQPCDLPNDLWAFEDGTVTPPSYPLAPLLPTIAIPTTAGTGSEVGRSSVITDSGSQRKRILFHPDMVPRWVLLDPMLTLSLPTHLTAATGLDALSHNLEAYCSANYHPMAEAVGLEGIRLIQQFLPVVYQDGQDVQARTQMLIAASMGATAFQKGLGAMHALSHTLGATYHQHHGLLNAVLMPYVLCANHRYLHEKMARLARYLDLPEQDFRAVLDWILALRQQLAIPHTLADLGLNDLDTQALGEKAHHDPAAQGNPIHLSPSQYSTILEHAMRGTLDI